MEHIPQRETTVLTLVFDTDPVFALGGRYISEFVKLDQSLLHQLEENIDEAILHGYPSASAYSLLQIKVVYKLKIFKDTKRYNETVQHQRIGPPLPDNEFEKLKDNHKYLISKIISFLAWRRGYTIQRGHVLENEIRWKWEMDGYHGDDSHEPRVTYTPGHDYAIVPIVPEVVVGSDFRDFYALYKEGQAIPLHHEILREARLNFSGNRSSYLILYSALEVATKALIKYKKPDTK